MPKKRNPIKNDYSASSSPSLLSDTNSIWQPVDTSQDKGTAQSSFATSLSLSHNSAAVVRLELSPLAYQREQGTTTDYGISDQNVQEGDGNNSTTSNDDGSDEEQVFVDEDCHSYHNGNVSSNANELESYKAYCEIVDEEFMVKVATFTDAWQGYVSWRMAWSHFWFPPHLPRQCQLLRPENIAIPACYLLVGLLQGFSSVMVGVFPLDLGATEAQQTTLQSLRNIPSSFKLVFGFLSDNVPIYGYRRKPYMLAGWLIVSLSQFALLGFSDLTLSTTGAGCFAESMITDHTEVESTQPSGAPSIPFLAMCFFTFGMGYWLADVMGDSMVAEKAKLEPEHSRGSVQSSCYSYRFFGLMVAAPMATYVYTKYGPAAVVQILAVLPLMILPLVYMLGEVHHKQVPSTREQCTEIWNTVCRRAVWQPLGVIFVYNILHIGNAAWREFERTVLHFTSCQLSLLSLVAYVLLYVGVVTYKYFLMQSSWRHVYFFTTLANAFFSIFQVLLIYGITFGLPAFWFAMGDDVFLDFVAGIQFLPNTIMVGTAA